MFKLKPLFGARICFIGFPEDDKQELCEVLQKQGGEPTEINDPTCTHVVSFFHSSFHKSQARGSY